MTMDEHLKGKNAEIRRLKTALEDSQLTINSDKRTIKDLDVCVHYPSPALYILIAHPNHKTDET